MTKDKLKKQEIGTGIKLDILENRAKKVYLSLGSNLGNKKKNLEKAKFCLQETKYIHIIKSSNYYVTPSWPNKKNPFFLNIVIEIRTNLAPYNLYKTVKNIETFLGRKKSIKNSPRTCDIDILDYDQKKIVTKPYLDKLIIPHPRLHTRNFVLLPLFEIAKKWKHPKLGRNIVYLINTLDQDNLRSIKVL